MLDSSCWKPSATGTASSASAGKEIQPGGFETGLDFAVSGTPNHEHN